MIEIHKPKWDILSIKEIPRLIWVDSTMRSDSWLVN